MVNIRRANFDDLDALYEITLKTGDRGSDASNLYSEEKLLGSIYSAPYLKYAPELAMVAEKNSVVLGYCVGTLNTHDFEQQLETDWWPSLRRQYQKPEKDRRSAWSADERCCQFIHQPDLIPKEVVRPFPAHLHMNLLPELQGEGIGTSLFKYWLDNARGFGVRAAHIGARADNHRAIQFWNKQGFECLPVSGVSEIADTVWMGRQKT